MCIFSGSSSEPNTKIRLAYHYTDTSCDQNLISDPVRYITIGSQQTEKSETDGHHDPPNVIDRAILLGHFNNDATNKGEGGDHESSGEEVNT